MGTQITMPRLSESMTEGKLLQWNVKVGDVVRAGDPIAEVEADKANMEIEALEDGTILELHGNAGDTIVVGAVLALIGPGAAGGSERPEVAKAAGTETSAKVSPLV